jgi:hypothetical protein
MITGLTSNGRAADMREFGATSLFHLTARCICNTSRCGSGCPTAAKLWKLDQVLDQKLFDEITYLPQTEVAKF